MPEQEEKVGVEYTQTKRAGFNLSFRRDQVKEYLVLLLLGLLLGLVLR